MKETESRKTARKNYCIRHDIVRVVMDMPRSVRDDLKQQAAAAGLSLTAYILRCVSAAADLIQQ